jgi:hypothetical protein
VNTFAKINNASCEFNGAIVDLKKKSICSHTKTLSQFPLANVLEINKNNQQNPKFYLYNSTMLK